MCQTPKVTGWPDATWNFKHQLDDLVVGDSLLFFVSGVSGHSVLRFTEFFPHGFNGDLEVRAAGKKSVAVLEVKCCIVLHGIGSNSPAMSSRAASWSSQDQQDFERYLAAARAGGRAAGGAAARCCGQPKLSSGYLHSCQNGWAAVKGNRMAEPCLNGNSLKAAGHMQASKRMSRSASAPRVSLPGETSPSQDWIRRNSRSEARAKLGMRREAEVRLAEWEAESQQKAARDRCDVARASVSLARDTQDLYSPGEDAASFAHWRLDGEQPLHRRRKSTPSGKDSEALRGDPRLCYFLPAPSETSFRTTLDESDDWSRVSRPLSPERIAELARLKEFTEAKVSSDQLSALMRQGTHATRQEMPSEVLHVMDTCGVPAHLYQDILADLEM